MSRKSKYLRYLRYLQFFSDPEKMKKEIELPQEVPIFKDVVIETVPKFNRGKTYEIPKSDEPTELTEEELDDFISLPEPKNTSIKVAAKPKQVVKQEKKGKK
jgi:hypothetical protein